MKQERKEIKFSGISNRSASIISGDGECCDLVNIRNKVGVWETTGAPTEVLKEGNYNFYDGSKRFIHANSDYRHIILYLNGTLFFEAEDIDGEIVMVNDIILNNSEITSIEGVGNILVIVTKSAISCALYINGAYKVLGDIEMPEIRFALIPDETFSSAASPFIFNEQFTDTNNMYTTDVELMETAILGVLAKRDDTAKSEGFFVNPFLVRYAIRLFDGSHIMPSPPILMMPAKEYGDYDEISSLIQFFDDSAPRLAYLWDKSTKEYLYYEALQLPGEDWDDIIDTIDIFISNPINRYASPSIISSYQNGSTNEYIAFKYELLSKTDFNSLVINEANYYKVDSISLSEARAKMEENSSLNSSDYDLTEWLTKVELYGELDSLTLQERLETDNYSHFKLGANTSFTYNSALHLGGVTQTYPYSFNFNIFTSPQETYNGIDISQGIEDNTSYTSCMAIRIKSDDGDRDSTSSSNGYKFVFKHFENFRGGLINPLISYPDKRAVNMSIYIYHNRTSNSCYWNTFELTPSLAENMAYHYMDDFSQIELLETTAERLTNTDNVTEYYPNMIRVSNTTNPFYFPQERTYSISNGEVIKLAAATKEISQGQFGEFPLYIFTTEGIWCMQIGSDTVLYSTQHPISGEVAISSSAITNVDSSIVFITEHGIMSITGSQTDTLSSDYGDYEEEFSSVNFTANNTTIVCSSDIYNGFKGYINSSSVEFDYVNKEIVFLKSGEDYFYTFSLNGSGWGRRIISNTELDSLISSYPELWISDKDGGVYNLSDEDIEAITPFAIISRNIKGSALCYKQLRGIFLSIDSEKIESPIYITVSASQNAKKGFIEIAKFKVENSLSESVRLPLRSNAYKYFRLTIYGSAANRFCFGNPILSFAPKFTNRLR